MAKKLLTAYTFTPGAANAGTVVVSGTYALEQFLLITNVSTGEVIYQFNKPTKGGTVASAGGQTTLTLEANTSGMSSTDRLQAFVEDSALGTVEISNTTPIPVWDNGGSLTVDGPLTDAQLRAAALPLPVGAASEEALEVLRAMFRLLKPLGQVSGSGRNHLAVDIANTAAISGTVTANQGGTWNIATVSAVTAVNGMANVWAFDQARALSRQAYNSGIRSRVS
jgi:hypothetical protein